MNPLESHVSGLEITMITLIPTNPMLCFGISAEGHDRDGTLKMFYISVYKAVYITKLSFLHLLFCSNTLIPSVPFL